MFLLSTGIHFSRGIREIEPSKASGRIVQDYTQTEDAVYT